MNGTVTGIRGFGVIVELDGTPQIGDLFEVYRVHDGVETILGKGYIRKQKPIGFKLNPMDDPEGNRGEPFVDVMMGDLVRSVEA